LAVLQDGHAPVPGAKPIIIIIIIIVYKIFCANFNIMLKYERLKNLISNKYLTCV